MFLAETGGFPYTGVVKTSDVMRATGSIFAGADLSALKGRRVASPTRKSGGFTLVEVMMATVILTMVALGIYTAMIKSYQMAALTRARDDARGVLRSYGDQFLRLQTTDLVSGTAYNRWLFNITAAPTGQGLVWGALSNTNTSVAAEDVEALPITLGGETNPIPALLTRHVRYVDATTGNSTTTQTIAAAGYFLVGTFTIKFNLVGKEHSQSITLVRAAP